MREAILSDYEVKATILSIGEFRQVGSPDKPKQLADIETQVGDTAVSYSAFSFHVAKLEEGKTYNLLIRPTSPDYPDGKASIWNVIGEVHGATPPSQAKAPAQAQPTPAPVPVAPPVETTDAPKPTYLNPDSSMRMREYFITNREAPRHATAMVTLMVNLHIAGLLCDNKGNTLAGTPLNIDDMVEWFKRHTDAYWREILVRRPVDSWGFLAGARTGEEDYIPEDFFKQGSGS